MELMKGVKGYSDSREEEEEEEAAEIITITREESNRLHQQDAAAPNFMNHRKQQRQQLDFMDLSLGTNKDDEPNFHQPSSAVAGGCSSSSSSHHHGHGASSSSSEPVEKEHMFDKVVTPSDVGKLNRLVIPKQHAEKYFPLDSSSNEKGLLLNFEDRNGKLWRFRYSYWNSSQSYVMTKGWSRFVKEKKLDAGDIVSFQRGLGELYRHRLYIDWRRRPDHPPDPSASLITPLFLPNQYSIRWGSGRLYSLPSPQASTVPHHHHDHFQHLNYNHMYAFHHHQQQQHHHQQQYHHVGGSGSHVNDYSELNSGSGSVYYLRSTPSMSMVDQTSPGQQQERGTIAPMIIDSVPVAHHHHHHHHQHQHQHHHHGVVASSSNSSSTAGKRLRLFGVNMECASSPAEDHVAMANSLPSSSSLPPLQRMRVPHEDPRSSSSARFGDRRGETSVLFDLDPSFQHRQ